MRTITNCLEPIDWGKACGKPRPCPAHAPDAVTATTRLNDMTPEVEFVVQYSEDGGDYGDACHGVDTFATEAQAIECAIEQARHYGQPSRYAWRVVRRTTDAYVHILVNMEGRA